MKLKRFFVRFFSISMLMMLLLSTGHMAHAQEVDINSTDGDIVTFAEQTEWYYRVVDGKPQKRLWSITWGKWLTEWEWL